MTPLQRALLVEDAIVEASHAWCDALEGLATDDGAVAMQNACAVAERLLRTIRIASHLVAGCVDCGRSFTRLGLERLDATARGARYCECGKELSNVAVSFDDRIAFDTCNVGSIRMR